MCYDSNNDRNLEYKYKIYEYSRSLEHNLGVLEFNKFYNPRLSSNNLLNSKVSELNLTTNKCKGNQTL